MDYDKGKDEDGSKKQAAEVPVPPLQENLYEKRLAKLLSDLKAVEERGYRKQLAEHCSAQRVIPINDGEEGVQQSDEPVDVGVDGVTGLKAGLGMVDDIFCSKIVLQALVQNFLVNF